MPQKGQTPLKSREENAIGAAVEFFANPCDNCCLNLDDFLQHYDRRSNVESTFSMIKAKFGDSLRGKSDAAMRNESLYKILCHNICCLIGSIYDLGIEPVFRG